MARIFPVVMAGGAGTRFWPLSRKARPKQLLDLCEPDVSMLAATVRRFRPIAKPEDILVVTGEIIAKDVAAAVPELPASSILAEPMGRNTAPCVGWAALHVRRRDPDGVMAVLPADHAIGDEPAFLEVVKRAAAASEAGAIATIGITPNRPETGYGYIELADEVSEGVRKVERFVEKPDLDTAKVYLEGGRHVWNSGTFFFTARTILAEIERQMPELWAGLEEMDAGIERGEETKAVADVYAPISGEVEEINEDLVDNLDNLSKDPFGAGWLAKIKMSYPEEIDSLMSPAEYEAFLEETGGEANS